MFKHPLQFIWLRSTANLKADAQNSYLGIIWWILEPLLLTSLIYLAFSSGLRGQGGKEFAYFLLCGMLPFKWTASCLTAGGNALLFNKGILGQSYYPKWIFPSIAVVTMSLRYCVALILLLVFLLIGDYPPQWSWLGIVYILACQLLLNFGTSYLLSALIPVVPDLSNLIPIITMGLMFTSGIFFDISTRPDEIQAILRLNPFVEIVESYREVLLQGNTIDFGNTLYAWLFGLCCLIVGALLLKKFDRHYPRLLP